jgi:hypothetical protein
MKTQAENMATFRRCQESWDDRLPAEWDDDSDEEGFILNSTRSDGEHCQVAMYMQFGYPAVDGVMTADGFDFSYSDEERDRWIKEAIKE